MSTIEIDFEAYKALTTRRATAPITYNEVIRDLLNLGAPVNVPSVPHAKEWEYRGVRFPHGTEFRANHKGAPYLAKVEDGRFLYNGRSMKSPSEAAHAVTGTSVNGWKFWECRLPGASRWRSIEALR